MGRCSVPSSVLARDAGLGVTIEDRHGVPLRSTRAATAATPGGSPTTASIPTSSTRSSPSRTSASGIIRVSTYSPLHERSGQPPRREDGLRRVDDHDAARATAPPRGAELAGKVAQALWSLRLETHLTKQQIMEQYLNRVHLGEGTVGVGAASALYFGASASEMSVAQAATLAGLAHAPSRDNPHVSSGRARRRQAVALARMHRLGFATKRDVARAREESLASAGRVAPFVAPHFTTRVVVLGRRPMARSAPTRASGRPRRRAAACARGRGPAYGGRAARSLRGARCRGRPRQRERRGVGVGRLAGLLGGERWSDRHGRVATAARVGAQAVPVRCRARPRLHRGQRASRHPEVISDGDRPISAAQLRSTVPRSDARARGARQLVQRAGGGAGIGVRRGDAVADAAIGRLRVAAARRRALRAWSLAWQR